MSDKRMNLPDAMSAAILVASLVAVGNESDQMSQFAMIWMLGCLIGIGIGITDVAQARAMRSQIALLLDVTEDDLTAINPIVETLLAAANP